VIVSKFDTGAAEEESVAPASLDGCELGGEQCPPSASVEVAVDIVRTRHRAA